MNWGARNMENRRKCFGTREYSENCGICKGCPHYIKCGLVRKRIIEKKKLKMKEGKHGMDEV